MNFRMELHRPHLSLGRCDRGHRTWGTGDQLEFGGQFYRFVAMRHPDREFCGESFEKAAGILDFNLGMTVLSFIRGAHLAAESVHHELESVTDAKHRQAQLKY